MRFNDSLSGSEWRQARDGRDSRQRPETCLMWQCPEKCSGGVHRLQGPPDAVGNLPRTKYRAREDLRTLHLTLPLENAKDTHFAPTVWNKDTRRDETVDSNSAAFWGLSFQENLLGVEISPVGPQKSSTSALPRSPPLIHHTPHTTPGALSLFFYLTCIS